LGESEEGGSKQSKSREKRRDCDATQRYARSRDRINTCEQ